jgi:hypothetical protein
MVEVVICERGGSGLCALGRRNTAGLDHSRMRDSCHRARSFGSRSLSTFWTNCCDIGDCLGGQVCRLLVGEAIGDGSSTRSDCVNVGCRDSKG